jgi:hypothetical protein
MPFQIVVKAYNSAGEEVALLYSGGISAMPASPGLSGTLLQPGHSGVNLVFAGSLQNGSNLLPWDGLSGGGSPLSGGIYHLKVESTDSFGATSTYNLALSVVVPAPANTISIFNSAGELVYQEGFHSLTSTVTGLSLQDGAFAPAFDLNGVAISKAKGMIHSSDGASSAWSWDGKNSKGEVVSAGIYTLQLSSAQNGVQQSKLYKKIQVLAAPEAFDAAPLAFYSPDGFVHLRYDPAGAAGGARAGLYSLAGELALRGAALQGSGALSLDARGLAGGIYILVFEYSSPSGQRKRSLLKVGIIK